MYVAFNSEDVSFSSAFNLPVRPKRFNKADSFLKSRFLPNEKVQRKPF